PEQLPLAEQFAIYARAPKLIFSEGSALHVYALVADARQEVLILKRRTADAGHLRLQLVALGLARVAQVDAIAETARRRPGLGRPNSNATHLDFDRLGAALAEHGFVPQASWRPPAPEAVAEDLARREAAGGAPQRSAR
ncbi:MAG: hypothetical protein MUF65_12785, partial [Rubritepida sp.]|nr:hypothetical protein [Rubritepida sp.]